MAAQKLALHICWQESKTTNMVVEVVCEIIADTNEEDFPNLFNLLSILVNMRDGLEKYRSEKVSYCFMRAVAENIQYNSMCIKCLEFLTQVKTFSVLLLCTWSFLSSQVECCLATLPPCFAPPSLHTNSPLTESLALGTTPALREFWLRS